MSGKFDDVLNDCLELLAQGGDIRQCIERYPEHEDELVPLLRIASVTMRATGSTSYSPQAKAHGLVRLNRALATRRKPPGGWMVPPISWRPLARPLLLGFVAVFLTAVAAGGTTVASSDSVPGDSLYWVKTAYENVSLKMPRSPMDKAKVHARLANERGEEIRTLIARGRVMDAERTLPRLKHHLNLAASHAGLVVPSNPEMPVRLIENQVERDAVALRRVLERDGTVLRDQMEQLVRDVPVTHQRRVRRMLHQSDLRYRLLVHALEEGDVTDNGPFFRIGQPFLASSR